MAAVVAPAPVTGTSPAAPPPPTPPPPAGTAGPPPPTSPPSPDDQSIQATLDVGRTLGILLALVAGGLFLVFLALGVYWAVRGVGDGAFVSAGYCLVSAAVNYLLWKEIPRVAPLVAARQYSVARDRLLVWTVLGFLFFVVEGIVLLIAWLKLDSMSHAPIVAAPATPPGPPCPRCGGPLTWVPEYQRPYCYRCATYA